MKKRNSKNRYYICCMETGGNGYLYLHGVIDAEHLIDLRKNWRDYYFEEKGIYPDTPRGHSPVKELYKIPKRLEDLTNEEVKVIFANKQTKPLKINLAFFLNL